MNIFFNKLLDWENIFFINEKTINAPGCVRLRPTRAGRVTSDLGKPVRFTQVSPV